MIGGMKKIKLANTKKVALIDDHDFQRIVSFKYHLDRSGHAARSKSIENVNRKIYIHWDIIGRKKGFDVDHINRNPLDNRKVNLRHCTRSENIMNVGLTKQNTTGYKGVSFHKRYKVYRAKIAFNGVRYEIGEYKTAKDGRVVDG